MKTETLHLSQDEALARVERDRVIDGYFFALSRGERPKAEGLDVEYLKQILTEAGANLDSEDREVAIKKLANKKYTEAHPNRRPGVVSVWGEEAIVSFEIWAQNVSVETCPRFKNDDELPIDGSQSRGLRQLLADLTELAIDGGMSAEELVKRTKIRVDRGRARSERKEVPKSDFAMIPVDSLEKFWKSIRGGELPH
jgi:hypothetical protein